MADGGNFILGRNNTASSTTRLVRDGAAGNDALVVQNNRGFGISGTGTVTSTSPRGTGVYGFSRASGEMIASPGVYGESTNGTGVHGESQTNGFGVHGTSFGTGIRGESRADGSGVFGSSVDGHGAVGLSSHPSRAGVFGRSTRRPNAEGAGVGVRGDSPDNAGVFGTSLDSVGVIGRSRNDTGVHGAFRPEGLQPEPPVGDGVSGFASSGRGVAGGSPSGFGVFGRADPLRSAGVVGFSNEGVGVAGVSATTPLPDGRVRGWAGQFDGKVFVRTNFVVRGTKSAAVPHPDGSHRQLYALESPESWFEDFGRGEITEGRTRVELDPDFAAVVRAEDYHVFLTPEGDSRGLYVASKESGGFEVREQQGGTSTLPFSYRVVARRADVEAQRLEKVELPPPIQQDARTSVPEPHFLDEQLEPPGSSGVLAEERST
jgi:hypothetical protein